MSPEDARALSRHVAPDISDHDLAHLGAYQAVCRLVVASEKAPVFTMRTRPAPPAAPGRAEAVRRAARKHGRNDEKAGEGTPTVRSLPQRGRVVTGVVSAVVPVVVSLVVLWCDDGTRSWSPASG